MRGRRSKTAGWRDHLSDPSGVGPVKSTGVPVDNLRVLNARSLDRTDGRRHRRRPWHRPGVLVLVGLTLLVAGGVGITQARRHSLDQAALDDRQAQFELTSVSVELAWLHHDLMLQALEAHHEGTTISDEAVAEFRADRDRLRGRVDLIGTRGEDVGGAAEQLNNALADDLGPWPIASDDLDTAHFLSMPDEEVIPVLDEQPPLLGSIRTSMVANLVLGDAVALAVDGDGAVPEWAAAYVTHTTDIAVSTPGWTGPDRDAPLARNVVVSPAQARFEATPRFEAALAEAADPLRHVWDVDRWIIDGRDPAAGPPVTLAELSAHVEEANGIIRPAVLASIDDEVQDLHEQANGGVGALWWALALAGVGGGMAVLGVGVVRSWRHQRSLSEAAFVDTLTGAHNRRFLDDEVAGWCRRQGHHLVVAVIDLDRFKLVNDTWGHAIGDALLVTTVRRLTTATEGLAPVGRGVSRSVVRLGGDEFAVVVSSPDPLDVDHLVNAIRAVSCPVDVGAEEPVPLELSVGTVTAVGPVTLDDLLAEADLATYEDKRRRSTSRGAGGGSAGGTDDGVTVDVVDEPEVQLPSSS